MTQSGTTALAAKNLNRQFIGIVKMSFKTSHKIITGDSRQMTEIEDKSVHLVSLHHHIGN